MKLPWNQEIQKIIKYSGIIIFLLIILIISLNLIPKDKKVVKNKRMTLPKEIRVDISDFILPDAFDEVWFKDWIPYRETKKQWTSKQTSPYWTEPEIIVVEILEDINNQKIEEMLKDIP
jgi:hypothetical protein